MTTIGANHSGRQIALTYRLRSHKLGGLRRAGPVPRASGDPPGGSLASAAPAGSMGSLVAVGWRPLARPRSTPALGPRTTLNHLGQRRPPMKPIKPAERMRSGNGTPKKKIATNEAAARPTITRFF